MYIYAIFISFLLLPLVALSETAQVINISALAEHGSSLSTCNAEILGQEESLLLITDSEKEVVIDEHGYIPDGFYTIVKCFLSLPESRTEKKSFIWAITRFGIGIEVKGERHGN
ncbi:hypothetical protein [uncultured Microbulbifer sp.]|uniref:hypothetical protein n=1 Tax=uncultured Microbulbifer sp. TaxID=348147 RepID=UPI00262FC028|nr:hypothetical protein [uncultured Microbulbifer sp.]